MKRGAFDYLTKPFDIDEAVMVAQKAIEAMKLARENEELRGELKEQYDPGKIIGKDASMEVVFKTIGRVTESDCSGSHHWRERHGQRTCCSRHPLSLQPCQGTVCRRELRGDPGESS